MTWNWARTWKTKGNRIAAGVASCRGVVFVDVNLQVAKGKLRGAIGLLFVSVWFRVGLTKDV